MASGNAALVAYPANPTPDWRVENVKVVRAPGAKELKIRILATGICHSDIVVASMPNGTAGINFPRVLGHEGAGIVEEVGEGVTVANVGDPVLLSYTNCQNCDLCKNDQHSYCANWFGLNIIGDKTVFQSSQGEEAPGKFFGQSSFAALSIVDEASVVNVKDQVSDHDELKLLAPLGCGLMTGSGAVINTNNAKPHDIVLVTGLGAVGLGAIMAAKVVGCKEIIAVDRVAHRLEIAKELGATKVLDTTKVADAASFAADIQALVPGQRISLAIEATGVSSVIINAINALGHFGKLIQLGVPRPGSELTLPLSEFFGANKSFQCQYLGNTTGQAWIPVMLKWWREGKFPVEKIVKYFPVKDAIQAIHAMEDGSVIKPVVVF